MVTNNFKWKTLYQNIENEYKLQCKLFREAQHGEDIKVKIDEITDIFDRQRCIYYIRKWIMFVLNKCCVCKLGNELLKMIILYLCKCITY